MTISTGVSAAKRLGDFEIVREIGRGGMGVVFEARQVSLNRKVALKVLSSSLGLSPQAIPRFRREAEAAAKLHHTNIVPVYATGAENGTYFYAMELIDGPSLDSVIRQLRQAQPDKAEAEPPGTPPGLAATSPSRQSPPAPDSTAAALTSSALNSDGHYFDSVAKMIAEVADALHYAHEQGVIHRDLKPSNLLLSPDGRLSVNDFGLARMLEQPGMTMTGEFVGTPAYMSPEQITAGRVPIDHRTDIYSLGATLYEMLTLQPPFTGERRDQVLAQILQKEPKAPRRLNRKVPVDLDTICLKAIDKDPDRRYQTAGELAADLRRYVNRFAIAARRAGPVERLQKWVKRHPGIAASLALMVVAVGAAGYFGYRLVAERRQFALEKATESALSGDLERARKAIVDAEKAGVSANQVHWLNGLVRYQQGKLDDAAKEFESSLTLKRTVAAKAMLAQSQFGKTIYTANPFGASWYKAVRELPSMKAVTPEDYMCRGIALALYQEDQSIADANKAVELRDSPIARVVRTRVWYLTAGISDPEELERGLADLEEAKKRLPDNSMVRYSSCLYHLHAAVRYGVAGQDRKRQAALAKAKDDVEVLRDLPISPYVMARLYYFEEIGDEDSALTLLQEASAREATKDLVMYYAQALYRRNKLQEALDVITQSGQAELPISKTLLVHVLSEHHRADEALKLARELGVLGPDANYVQQSFSSIPALLFAGQRAEVCDIIRRMAALRVLPTSKPDDPFARFAPSVPYLTGEISEEAYLKKTGDSLSRQFGAYHLIGLVRLSGGDRAGAREAFQKAVDTHWRAQLAYLYCRIYLERLKQDPTWPPWIPVKE